MTEISRPLWQTLKSGDVISLWGIMSNLWINGEQLWVYTNALTLLQISTSLEKAGHPSLAKASKEISPKIENSIVLDSTIQFCEYFNLAITKDTIEKLVAMPGGAENITSQQIQMISLVLQSELRQIQFLMIGRDKASYWNKLSFGVEAFAVTQAYPQTLFDLQEAHNCFAVSRYTASVFHLMRSTELIVIELAKKMGATVTDSNGNGLAWGKLVANIKDKILDKNFTPTNKNDWFEVNAILISANKSFRTSTMHPKQSYTEDEAKTIFTFVSSVFKSAFSLLDVPEELSS